MCNPNWLLVIYVQQHQNQSSKILTETSIFKLKNFFRIFQLNSDMWISCGGRRDFQYPVFIMPFYIDCKCYIVVFIYRFWNIY